MSPELVFEQNIECLKEVKNRICFYVLRSLQNNSGKNTLCVTIALHGTGKLQLYNLVASN